ncbi:prevent-host-death protein [Rhizobium sp. FKL33]|jgi:PHD/YefM family antitoxin component YafN of YafNO toxin-antitoxin module|uniref:prevent-host-death protein n=1 Tax=Rhizobium sp. FKL33 TaxID=2562307 RepID=UPI0010C105C8|nr:prevent-host-death protein [Rhizobium sp. FKL33]
MTVMSAREFTRDLKKARELASAGPVFVFDEGKQAGVWISPEEYELLLKRGLKNSERLSRHGGAVEDFEPVILNDSILRPAEFD